MSPKQKARKPRKTAKARASRKAPAPAEPRAPEQAGPQEDERQQDEPLEPEVLAAEAGDVEAEDLRDESPAPTSNLPVPVGRDLARADALQRYMAEVSRHSLLSREEEHDLAVRFQQTHDPEIAYRLVTANLRLVVKIAHEYRRAEGTRDLLGTVGVRPVRPARG